MRREKKHGVTQNLKVQSSLNTKKKKEKCSFISFHSFSQLLKFFLNYYCIYPSIGLISLIAGGPATGIDPGGAAP